MFRRSSLSPGPQESRNLFISSRSKVRLSIPQLCCCCCCTCPFLSSRDQLAVQVLMTQPRAPCRKKGYELRRNGLEACGREVPLGAGQGSPDQNRLLSTKQHFSSYHKNGLAYSGFNFERTNPSSRVFRNFCSRLQSIFFCPGCFKGFWCSTTKKSTTTRPSSSTATAAATAAAGISFQTQLGTSENPKYVTKF